MQPDLLRRLVDRLDIDPAISDQAEMVLAAYESGGLI
jgi:hypothetical protein